MIPAEATGRWSSISLMVLEGEAVLRRFLRVFDWFIEQIKATQDADGW